MSAKVDKVEPQIRELPQAYPRMPAPVVAERIGWAYRITILKDRIRELRPLLLPPDPSGRTPYATRGYAGTRNLRAVQEALSATPRSPRQNE